MAKVTITFEDKRGGKKVDVKATFEPEAVRGKWTPAQRAALDLLTAMAATRGNKKPVRIEGEDE